MNIMMLRLILPYLLDILSFSTGLPDSVIYDVTKSDVIFPANSISLTSESFCNKSSNNLLTFFWYDYFFPVSYLLLIILV